MTEIKDKIIGGQVTETYSSDSYNTRRLGELEEEAYGENGTIVDLDEKDIKAPYGIINLNSSMIGDSGSLIEMDDNTGSSGSYSVIQIYEARIQKNIARQIGDKVALEELRKAA